MTDKMLIDAAWNKHKKELDQLKDFYKCRCSGDFVCTPCLIVGNAREFISQRMIEILENQE